MATFPTGGKITFSGFKRNRVSNILRSDMEAGPSKQAKRSFRDFINFPVTYIFTDTEYAAFDVWVRDTISAVDWFDWIDPVSGSTIQARIINGDISEAVPLNPQMDTWLVKFMLETLE